MTIHLLKLCVGADTIDDLAAWRDICLKEAKKKKRPPLMPHVTRMHPRRESEILDGGSLYWVIKGFISARQRVERLEPVVGADGIERCAILLDPEIIPTQAQARRPFQGWRYLKVEDAPGDVGKGAATDMPPQLHAELSELGLL